MQTDDTCNCTKNGKVSYTLKKFQFELNPSPDIVATFHCQCFPGCGSLTFGYVLDRLAESCDEFRQELEAGNWVEKAEATALSATNGFTSRVFLFKISMSNRVALLLERPLIVKVFSLDRVDELVCHIVGGKAKMDEMMEEMREIMLKQKEIALAEGNNLNDGIGINKGVNQPADELKKKKTTMAMAPPVNGKKKNEKEAANAAAVVAEEEEQPYAFHHHDFFMQMHRNECTFYEFIKSNATSKQMPAPVPLPQVYFTQLGFASAAAGVGQTGQSEPEENEANGAQKKGAAEGQQNGLILMENMSAGTHMLSFVDGPNEEQCMAIATHLAHLHAYFIGLGSGPDADWKRLFLRQKQMFGRKESKLKMFDLMRAQLSEGAQKDELLAPLNRMHRVLAGIEYGTWAMEQWQGKYGVPELLIHGDLWVNNLLWWNDAPEKVAAFIDWQLTLIGNPMSDMAHFLLLNMDSELRHRLEADNHIFVHYMQAMRAKLAENGQEEAVSFGVDEIRHAYNLVLVEQALASVFIVPFFQRAWATDADLDIKMGKIMPRAAAALQDAIQVLDAEAPQWLDAEDPVADPAAMHQ